MVDPVEIEWIHKQAITCYTKAKRKKITAYKKGEQMAYTKMILAAAVAMALTACDKNGMNGDGDLASTSPNGGLNGSGQAGLDGSINSAALDPNSVAYFQQTIGDRVLFMVDQSTLTPEGAAILDGQAAWLLDRPGTQVLIEGHADEQGTREYNLALGARRASSVLNYLVSKGLPVSQIRTVTYGKERPLEVCSDEACWSKNRRAVTVVAGGLSS